ncbi:DUF2970 domain-containing protein [Methylomonas paludis]|uniref:DUF2970 domain-containing protein n=1 Tax=Methylomonas paludis TaxID=1173101 RepID=A0A975RA11_9GAMM|nr:DUF2970 domain-containing protein [Methylomonas paludis]QWF70848.1 DUF2970 domain-containing protein [Methylomonas paludis]
MTKTNLLQVVKSVISAFIGVQSNSNREHDFKNGSLPAFIIVGLIATLVFILAIAKLASLATGQ